MSEQQSEPSSNPTNSTSTTTTTTTEQEPPSSRKFITAENNSEFDSQISVRTRLEPLSNDLPERFYSPIWYQFYHKMSDSCKEQFLVVKCNVFVEGEAPKKLIKTNCLNEWVLSRNKQNQMEGVTKIKIQESSYHYQKKNFLIEFNYYMSHDLEKPILSKVSPPFKVFSRKPKTKGKSPPKTNKTLGKRKRENSSPTKLIGDSPRISLIPPLKKRKLSPLPSIDTEYNGLSDLSIPLKRPRTLDYPIPIPPNPNKDGMAFVMTSMMGISKNGNSYEQGNPEFQIKLNELVKCADNLNSINEKRKCLINSMVAILAKYQSIL